MHFSLKHKGRELNLPRSPSVKISAGPWLNRLRFSDGAFRSSHRRASTASVDSRSSERREVLGQVRESGARWAQGGAAGVPGTNVDSGGDGSGRREAETGVRGRTVRLSLAYGIRTALAGEIWFRNGVAHRLRNELDEAEAGWRRVLSLRRPEEFRRPPLLMAPSGRGRGGARLGRWRGFFELSIVFERKKFANRTSCRGCELWRVLGG